MGTSRKKNQGKKKENDTAEIELPPLDTPVIHGPPLSALVEVEFGAISHPGKVRPNNEDHFLVFRLSRVMDILLTNLPPDEIPTRFEEHGYCMTVADGMGGMAAGEIASRTAIKSGMQMLLDEVKWNLKMTEHEAREIMDQMVTYVRSLDLSLTEQARFDKSLAGMGTTLTVAYSVGAELFTLHVGDSRLYLFRAEKLMQLTRDHTVAQSLADAGEIAPEQVATHRQRHVLTSAIGGHAGLVKADVQRYQLQDGDLVLLCSDGLTDLVNDEKIARVLQRKVTPQQACEKLVQMALDQGGRDNITVVLGRYSIPERRS